MIKSIEIKNFRCYQNAKIDDCRRINLIVGNNGSGKTSLLESIFLNSGGSVEVAFRLRAIRGYDAGFSGSANDIDDALWRDLFYHFNKRSEIEIAILGTEQRNRRLTVRSKELAGVTQSLSKRESVEDLSSKSPVEFSWTGPLGRKVVSRPAIRDGKIHFPPAVPLQEETFFFNASQNYSSAETARRFSDLSKNFQDKPIVERFRQHFEMVQDLSIEIVAGQPMVCAKIEGMPEKVPLNLISSGMTKLASIIFAISSKNGSVVLVDEIENGIHFRKFEVMWRSLLDFCKSSNSQLFASTHSDECLKAAALVAESSPEDFSVIHSDGRGNLRKYDGSTFVSAIDKDIEIR